MHLLLFQLNLDVLANVSACIWIWLPKDQAKTVDEVTIVGTIHSNDLLACRYLEMLPRGGSSLSCRWFIPLLVDNIISGASQNSQAVDEAALVSLVDVDISDAFCLIDFKGLLDQLCLVRLETSVQSGALDPSCEG